MKHLVAYITAGYPDKNFTVDLALALGENGVDTLELGVPFSDPVADGPVIEAANHAALANGFKFTDLIEISTAVAPKIDTLWMGYFNPFYQYGMEALLDKAASIGVNGLIIPDVPYEEAKNYHNLFESRALANITFVAPTDGEERIKLITAEARKFIYLVAYAGITGSGKAEDLAPTLEMIKRHTQTPVYVGFGVNEKTAREKVQGADGVIVGSAIVNVLLDDTISATQKIARCCEITRTIKSLINS
ncbi:MAG: tryptophan synthase subunit alpha [Sulfuricurvum sp.]|uniref:tryptophan synthase subunit alpha n=1 Tax=Sulfuricurvum sp. TaxID=2025608 RepID=UPI00260F0D53|nr:tryptophan synthase subunit alpha [Sulfuricurvum sp.]MDD2829767.1 tryptophan synthase subunit alpha [Sulfuricurvum sp.]MDD4948439.1 tryptophan synthase subunit alpha [Sulfuricurvum sp.]